VDPAGLSLAELYRCLAEGEFCSFLSQTVVSTLAPIVIFFFTQRTFLQGIVITGVKG
jgi:ABC-type glycerol-3-phosphate transport system permease component